MREFLYKKRILITIMLLITIALLVISIIPTNYDVTSPGDLNKVSSVINVNTEYKETGSFNTTSVYVNEKCSILTYLLGKLSKANIIEKTSEQIDGTSVRNKDSGKIQKNVSITNAIICAYEKANKKIEYQYEGVIIHTLANYASNDLKVGDVISKVDGQEFKNTSEFLMLYNEARMNKLYFDQKNGVCHLPLTINGEDKIITSNYIVSNDIESYPVFGFYYYDYNTIIEDSAEPTYTLNKVSTSGPSGGLMQTLAIFNALTEVDYTFGLKVAGTGTIEVDGTVGAIGGMYSKVYTAYYAGADVFFVPYYETESGETNYEEALRAYKDLECPKDFKIVPVRNFQDAIDYLLSLEANND